MGTYLQIEEIVSETEETPSTPTESSSVVALDTSSDGEDETSGTRLREDQESHPRLRRRSRRRRRRFASFVLRRKQEDESVIKQKKEIKEKEKINRSSALLTRGWKPP